MMLRALLVLPAAALLVTGCAGGSSDTSSPGRETALEKAVAECDSNRTHTDTGDDGHTLVIGYSTAAGYRDARCVLRYLGVSDALRQRIEGTGARTGRQRADEGGFHYTWSYHGGSGLDLTITDRTTSVAG